MAIADNTCTAASDTTIVPTQEDLTSTIVVLLASAAAAAQPDVPSTYKPTLSAVIDPYSTIINIATREGVNTYKTMIKPDHAWIHQTVSVETDTRMIDLFKDKEIQYGLDNILRVPKSGTSVADANPHTLPGSEVYNIDLADFTNLLEDYHHLTDNQVVILSG